MRRNATPAGMTRSHQRSAGRFPRTRRAIAALGLLATCAACAFATPSLESFAFSAGGNSSGPLGGCTTFGAPAAVAAFFGGGLGVPLDGLAACGVAGDFVDYTSLTGPLSATRSVNSSWLGAAYAGTATANADYGAFSSSSHGQFSGSTGSTTVAGSECFGRSSDSFTITSPSVPNGQPGNFRILVTVTGGLSLGANGTADVELNYKYGPSIYTMFRSQASSVAAVPFLNSIFGAGLAGFALAPGSMSGSGQVTTFAHPMTFGTPVDFGLGLFTYVIPTNPVNATADAQFTAYISGILVSGPANQTLTDFTIVSASGTPYGPTGLAAVDDGAAGPTLEAVSLRALPNPSAHGTRLDFRLPASEAGKLAIYDATGRAVRQLDTGAPYAAARRSAWWDARDASGASVPDGIYYARLQWSGGSKTTRVLVLR